MSPTAEILSMDELRQRTVSDLRGMLAKARQTAYEARFKHASRASQKTHLLGQLRRQVARIATALTQIDKHKA